MRKPLLIIFALVIVLLLIFLWVYLLFFRTAGPTPIDAIPFPEVPATFPDGDVTFDNSTNKATDTDTPLIDVNDVKRIRQLTTRPVSGFTEIFTTSSTTPTVRYAEAGTGIIFDINMDTGLESTVTTYVQNQNHVAVFSPSGDQVVLQTDFGKNTRSVLGVGVSASTTARYIDLPVGIEYPKFINENTILFIERTNESVVAQSYNIDTASTNTLFTIPFREVIVIWGTSLTGPHYAYPKPSARLEGFALQIINGSIARLPIDGYGFTMEANDQYILFSKRQDEQYVSFIYNLALGTTLPAGIVGLPEKCDFGGQTFTFICGHQQDRFDISFPDVWYQGSKKFTDEIWIIIPYEGTAESDVNLLAESGRQIDVTNLNIGRNEANYYFANKLDNTLWVYNTLIKTKQ